MKKRFLAVGFALALSIAAAPVALIANAEVKLEECDKVFAETINSLVEKSDVENGRITARRKPLYDISIETLGYVYEFSLKGGDGYAIVINADGNYIAQEFIPHSLSPYAECEGQCVYVGNMTYLEYYDGVYTDANSGTVLPDEIISCLAEDALYGAGGVTSGTLTFSIYYADRTRNFYRIANSTPYYSSSPYLSACACVAGANLVGFFDKNLPDLIPDFEPGYYYMGNYYYYGESSKITSVITQLYSDMGTTASEGTTTAQFLSGMTKYARRAGYTFGYTSCMSGSSFSYSAAKSSMVIGRPTVLFLSGYNVLAIGQHEGYDTMAYALYEANHVMVGFGYNEITYTYDSGGQQTFRYLYVASGVDNNPEGYFNIDYNTNINDAYAVDIH